MKKGIHLGINIPINILILFIINAIKLIIFSHRNINIITFYEKYVIEYALVYCLAMLSVRAFFCFVLFDSTLSQSFLYYRSNRLAVQITKSEQYTLSKIARVEIASQMDI